MPDKREPMLATYKVTIFTGSVLIIACIYIGIGGDWRSAIAMAFGGAIGLSIGMFFYALFSGDFDAR